MKEETENYIIEKERIYIKNNNGEVIAEITFPEIETGVYDINHTFVDESLRGKGIASQLVKMAIQEIENKNGKYVTSCSYAKTWVERNGK